MKPAKASLAQGSSINPSCLGSIQEVPASGFSCSDDNYAAVEKRTRQLTHNEGVHKALAYNLASMLDEARNLRKTEEAMRLLVQSHPAAEGALVKMVEEANQAEEEARLATTELIWADKILRYIKEDEESMGKYCYLTFPNISTTGVVRGAWHLRNSQ